MFVQVMQGRVGDQARLRKQLDRWMSELAEGANGWQGMTGGIAADGEFVALVRFESEEAARANSDRPEQGAWWNETAGCFDGEVSFTDCRDVDLFMGGGSDDAGFVQVMQGKADREALASRAREVEQLLRRVRPDVIGGVIAWHGDGRFTQAVYFTNEAEAREGEAREVSQEDAEARDEGMSSFEDIRFVDLLEPWLYSPA